MTRAELFKKVGVKDEAEFYAKYPSAEDFSNAHPDIPVMGLGGFLGKIAKTVLPMAAGLIPGVGGIAQQAVGTIMNSIGNKEGGQAGQKGGVGKELLGAGIGMAGNLISGLFGKKNKTGMAPIAMAGAAGAQAINSAQMQNEARDKFIAGLQPNIKALTDQFGDDENPLLLRHGGFGKYKYAGTVEEADVVPQSMRSSGRVNAEVEAAEVVEDTDGNIEYVDPANPHANDHEQGGALMEDAQRVLEATSTKKGRGDWRDKVLRLSPDQAEKVTGVRPKTSVSHAGALMKADEHFGKKRAKYTKAIDKVNKMKRPDKLSMESAKLNFKVGKTLPTKEQLFDNLFDHQEEVKTNTGITSGEEMQYGGIKKMQYGDPPKDKRLKPGYKRVEYPNLSPNYSGKKFPGNKTARQVITVGQPLKPGEKLGSNELGLPADAFRPGTAPLAPGEVPPSIRGTWDPIGQRSDDLMKDMLQEKYNTKDMWPVTVVGKKKKLATTPVTTSTAKKKTTAATTGSADTPVKIGTNYGGSDAAAIMPGASEPVKSWDQLRENKDMAGYNRPQTGSSSSSQSQAVQGSSTYKNENMDALDYKPLVDALALRKAPVRFSPIDLEKAKLKRVSARPAMNEVESDYRAALKQVGDDPGAVAQVFAKKYEMNNQIRGNYENMNTQIENQETLGNTEIANKEALLKNQNLDQFDAKVQTRDANYNSVKNDLLNSFGKNLRANRQFNRNAKLMLEFSGKGLYDQNGNFIPSRGYQFSGGTSLPQEENGNTTVSNTQFNRGFDIDGRRVITGTTRSTTKPKKKMIGGKVRFK